MENENENENDINPNPEVKLETYEIISQFKPKKDDEDDDDEKSKEIDLPTPESLEKLCSLQLVKDCITFDINKYKSFFEEKNEKKVLNLDKVKSMSADIYPYVLIFLGGINSTTDIYTYFEIMENTTQEYYIDYSKTYLEYLNLMISFMRDHDNISIPLNQIDNILKALDELGINIHKEDKNLLYRNIKDTFYALDKNKILVILAPSNNFWIKSENMTINDYNYDMKLNNYNNIFYNKYFIPKFLQAIAKHPRCAFGLLCSMNYKNLKNCWDGLEKQYSNDCPKNIIFFDQKTGHDEAVEEKIDEKTKKTYKKSIFYRSMKKIIEHLKNEKSKKKKKKNEEEEEEGDNIKTFDETKIIILESEKTKITESTINNSIYFNVFDEAYLKMENKERESFNLTVDEQINKIKELLEKCGDDIRDYINKNFKGTKYSLKD